MCQKLKSYSDKKKIKEVQDYVSFLNRLSKGKKVSSHIFKQVFCENNISHFGRCQICRDYWIEIILEKLPPKQALAFACIHGGLIVGKKSMSKVFGKSYQSYISNTKKIIRIILDGEHYYDK